MIDAPETAELPAFIQHRFRKCGLAGIDMRQKPKAYLVFRCVSLLLAHEKCLPVPPLKLNFDLINSIPLFEDTDNISCGRESKLGGANQDLLLKKNAFFAILKTDFSRADTERPLFYCIRGVSENKFTAFRMHPKGAYFRTHETYELRKGNDHEENRF